MVKLFQAAPRRTIELSFDDFNTGCQSKMNNNKQQPNTVKTCNFDGLVIEVLEPKAKSLAKPKTLDADQSSYTISPSSLSKVNEDQKLGAVPKLSTTNPIRNPTISKQNQVPMNLNYVSGATSSKSMFSVTPSEKSQSTYRVEKLPTKDFKVKPVQQTSDGAGSSGAAEVKSSLLTEEDWEVFKKFLIFDKPDTAKPQKSVKSDKFKCVMCEVSIINHDGFMLKGCSHKFCRFCLIDHCMNNHDALGEVKCPFPLGRCENMIDDEEVKVLLGDRYDAFANKIMQMLQALVNENKAATQKQMLLEAEKHDFIKSIEEFECGICFDEVAIGNGVTLKNCLHKFCTECLIETVKNCDDPEVNCPDSDCKFKMQDREIRGLVPTEVYEKHLEKSLKLYEGTCGTRAFHCKTLNCPGFIEIDENVRGFLCYVCEKVNCIGCKVIHMGKNCQEYEDEVNPNGKHKRANEESENAIKNMVAKGEALWCPRCGIPVMKDEGCDFIKCRTCQLGICWVTQKPRQPFTKENGELVDGCHCKENNGALCDPKCRYCH